MYCYYDYLNWIYQRNKCNFIFPVYELQFPLSQTDELLTIGYVLVFIS